jgi:hypothetical protein
MANFRVPKDADPFSEALGDIQDDDEDTEVIGMSPAMSDVKELNLRREIYSNWIDLHPTTKNNLLRFEQDDYHLPAQASGEENVCELVYSFFILNNGWTDFGLPIACTGQ